MVLTISSQRDKQNQERRISSTRSDKHYTNATNDNSFHNKAGWHTHTHTHTHTCANTAIEPERGGGVGRNPLDILYGQTPSPQHYHTTPKWTPRSASYDLLSINIELLLSSLSVPSFLHFVSGCYASAQPKHALISKYV